jgi:hypothetical protein
MPANDGFAISTPLSQMLFGGRAPRPNVAAGHVGLVNDLLPVAQGLSPAVHPVVILIIANSCDDYRGLAGFCVLLARRSRVAQYSRRIKRLPLAKARRLNSLHQTYRYTIIQQNAFATNCLSKLQRHPEPI